MVLTRQEKERLVLDLYNQGKTAKEIAKTVHMSFRDIGTIIREQEQKQEIKEVQSQQQYLSSQAYRLFSKGKTPVQVGIELNLRQPEVTSLYGEYCKLTQLENVFRAYEELKGDIEPFVELYRLVKAAGMNVQHVNNLLTIANHHLPSLQSRYENLKRQVSSMEGQVRNSTIVFQELTDQISNLYKTSDACRLECEKEKEGLASLQQKRMKLEALVRQFENDNETYNNIRKATEEKVADTLANRKELLEFAVLSLIESIRNNPEKYRSLIPYDSSTDYPIPDFNPFYYMYGQQQLLPQQPIQSKVYFTEDYVAMLSEDADKVLEKVVKELGHEVINGYTASSTSTSPSLPLLPASYEDSPPN